MILHWIIKEISELKRKIQGDHICEKVELAAKTNVEAIYYIVTVK